MTTKVRQIGVYPEPKIRYSVGDTVKSFAGNDVLLGSETAKVLAIIAVDMPTEDGYTVTRYRVQLQILSGRNKAVYGMRMESHSPSTLAKID